MAQIYTGGQSVNIVQDSKPVLKKGRWYSTLDVYWCFDSPHYCCPIQGFESELDGEIVAETTLPRCCQCLGPFTVVHKGSQPLGEHDPHCYICKFGFCGLWNWFHPCCMNLNVKDEKGMPIYQIERVPCTCLCCTEWTIYDQAHMMKGNFQTGSCCYPHVEINLPPDREEHKRLLLGAFGVLP